MNQFGRSTDNGRVGLHALAGMKYFMNRNLAVFAGYKFNYAQFEFAQMQGTGAGSTANRWPAMWWEDWFDLSGIKGGIHWL